MVRHITYTTDSSLFKGLVITHLFSAMSTGTPHVGFALLHFKHEWFLIINFPLFRDILSSGIFCSRVVELLFCLIRETKLANCRVRLKNMDNSSTMIQGPGKVLIAMKEVFNQQLS